jgi:hypothetical protein
MTGLATSGRRILNMTHKKKKQVPVMSDVERDVLIDTLQSMLHHVKAEFIGVAPDWAPLENLLPPDWWDGWMFMEHDGDIRCYKHGITRRYLNIDSFGKCYIYRSAKRGWKEIDPTLAIDQAYKGIEKLGETRTSKYDKAYMESKYAHLEKAGITIIK